MKLLLADDDRVSARLLRRIFLGAGYQVTVVEDGRQAVQEIVRTHYDALVVDWMMPELDGISVIREVRANKSLSPFIVMVTALDNDPAKRHALNSGADDFLAKPIRPQELLNVLRKGLGRKVAIHRAPNT